jgi:copper transport protein
MKIGRPLFVALMIACAATVAGAHATLLQTEPRPGSQMQDSPENVRLFFNERVETIFNSVEVLDERGKRVDDGSPRVIGEGDAIEVKLKSVGSGKYTVAWQVSSVDGHRVQGRFGFGVRSPAPLESEMRLAPAPTDGLFWKAYAPVVKWLGFTATTAWLGGLAFMVWIFQPTIANDSAKSNGQKAPLEVAAQRIHAILWIAIFVFFVSQILALIGQMVSLTGLPIAEAFSLGTLRAVLARTNYGHWWIVRMLSGMGLLGFCIFSIRLGNSEGSGIVVKSRTNILPQACSCALGSMMLLSISMSGHAVGVPKQTILAVGADWVHLAATVTWTGGLIYLWAIVAAVERKSEQVASLTSLVHRFSRLARICVALLLVTGAYSAWIHMPHWSSFTSTDYGRVLLGKLLLVIVILLIALVNLRRVLPALVQVAREPQGNFNWIRHFRALIKAEAVLAGAILLAAVLLTSLPPATASAMTGPIRLSQGNGSITVGLTLDSGQVGFHRAVVSLLDSFGHPIPDARRVTLFFQMPEMDMGLKTVQAERASDGTYQADLDFAMAGKWEISVEVEPPRGDTFVTKFYISTGY